MISHGRRNILQFNVTEHPPGSWIAQQLREAFPEDRAPQYLILDRDGTFNGDVATVPGRTEWRMESCRRELLDHVIVLNESHLRRLLLDYLE